MSAGLFSLAEQVLQTVGVAGIAGLWALKLAVTAIFFRIYQKRTGSRGPVMIGWIGRYVMRRRVTDGTNGR